MCLARQSVGKQGSAVLAKSDAVAHPVQNIFQKPQIFAIGFILKVNYNEI